MSLESKYGQLDTTPWTSPSTLIEAYGRICAVGGALPPALAVAASLRDATFAIKQAEILIYKPFNYRAPAAAAQT